MCVHSGTFFSHQQTIFSPPPPKTILFVSWKCEFGESRVPLPLLPLSQLQVRPLGTFNHTHRGLGLHIAWGDITILMLHSTPGTNECHKKICMNSIFLRPHPYPSFHRSLHFFPFSCPFTSVIFVFFVFFQPSATPPIPSHSLV